MISYCSVTVNHANAHAQCMRGFNFVLVNAMSHAEMTRAFQYHIQVSSHQSTWLRLLRWRMTDNNRINPGAYSIQLHQSGERERVEEGERESENILKFVSFNQCVYFTVQSLWIKINWLYTFTGRTHNLGKL